MSKEDLKENKEVEILNQFLNSANEGEELVFQNEVYKFWDNNAVYKDLYISNTTDVNPRSIGILVENKKNLVLDFNNATLLFHGQICPIVIMNCENITVKNVAIDWNISLNAEGTITKSQDDYIEVSINPSMYPFCVEDDRLHFITDTFKTPSARVTLYNSETMEVRENTPDTFNSTHQEKIDENTVRFYGDYKENPPIKGDICVIKHSPRINPGMLIEKSKNIKLENVTIHNTSGLGILSQFCENLSFEKVKFTPNTKKGRKILSSHDDGIHCSNNKGLISVKNCYFYGLMDDPINIHGTSASVTDIKGDVIYGKFMHHQATDFDAWALPNDEISILESLTLKRIASVTVKSYELINSTDFVLHLANAISLDEGIKYSIENMTNNPSVICENNYFGPCRARGVLTSTPKKVIIRNNYFNSAGSAVLIAGDANLWYESSCCRDLLIENNFFDASCNTSHYHFSKAIISILPDIVNPGPTYHSNISIVNNKFHYSNNRVLYALAVDNLKVENNTFIYSHEFKNKDEEFALCEHCKNVSIKDNVYLSDELNTHIKMIDCTD